MAAPEIIEEYGLRIGLLDQDAADDGRDYAEYDLDLLRILDPALERRKELAVRGFLVQPSWITWLAPVGRDPEEFVAAMADGERTNVRRALREVAERRLEITVRAPLTAAVLDSFLRLYREQIAAMRNGHDFAGKWRERMAAAPESFFAVTASEPGGAVLGACICHDLPETDLAVIRFTVQSAAERRGRLVRALYVAAAAEARARGRGRVSLGSDPSLYGHLTQPGLFGFKARLGFQPVPTRLIQPEDADRADRVLRLRALTDPALAVCYADPSAEPEFDPRLSAVLLSRSQDPDTAPFRAGFLAALRTRMISEL